MLPSQSGSEYFVWKNLQSLQEYQVMELFDFVHVSLQISEKCWNFLKGGGGQQGGEI